MLQSARFKTLRELPITWIMKGETQPNQFFSRSNYVLLKANQPKKEMLISFYSLEWMHIKCIYIFIEIYMVIEWDLPSIVLSVSCWHIFFRTSENDQI